MSQNRKEAFSKKMEKSDLIRDCRPTSKFPTVSLTGEECKLECDYCQAKYLSGMVPIKSSDHLLKFSISLDSDGGRGILLSGGYNEEGYLPISPFLDTISEIKNRTDLFIALHPGLVPKDLAHKLGKVGIDAAYFDFLVDDSVIQNNIGLDRDSSDYIQCLEILNEEIPYVVPHIVLGLSNNGLSGERIALSTLSNYEVPSIVFLIIMPPAEFPAKYSIPSPGEIGEFFAEARLAFPETTLCLGCMRPRGEIKKEIEKRAIEAGIDRIAMTSKPSIETAREKGFRIEEVNSCCAIPEEIIERWSNGRDD